MTEPEPTVTYSTDPDVRHVLGRVGHRLPDYIDVPTFRSTSYATLGERLAGIYRKVPTFVTPNAVTALRWAEARLAAAEILDILAADLSDDVREVPERLRASVEQTLAGGIVGYPPDSLDDDGVAIPVRPYLPAISHLTPGSLFPNPYDPDDLPVWPW